MILDDYAVEYAVKRATNKAFWWNKYDDPKDKREIQKIAMKDPFAITMLVILLISTVVIIFISYFLVALKGFRIENVLTIDIVVVWIVLLPTFSAKYYILKNYFQEKLERS